MRMKADDRRILPKRLFRYSLLLIALITAGLIPPAPPATADSLSISHELDVGFGYSGGATTLQKEQHIGSVNELNSNVKYVISPQVTKDLLLRFGAEWERLSFATPPGAALPDPLQRVNAVIGFDYQLAEQWLMRAEVMPGVYGDFRNVGWDSFDAPFDLGFAYLQDADLQWFFGLRVDPRSEYPVLPAAGVRWQYADNWTLNLQLPNPRLEYTVNDDLQMYIGAGIKAATYVVGDHFGDAHGIPRLNKATVDYFEVRTGPGLSWKVTPQITLEAEGGAMVNRTWNFFDRDVDLESRPAPYFQIACRARF